MNGMDYKEWTFSSNNRNDYSQGAFSRWDRLAQKWKFYSPHISIATPYPGTEIYDLCQERNYLFKDFNLDNLCITKHSFQTPEWSAAELDELIEKEWRVLKFYEYLSHPSLLLGRLISKLRNPADFLSGIWKVLKCLISKLSETRLIKKLGVNNDSA